jgi:hypothetical protein
MSGGELDYSYFRVQMAAEGLQDKLMEMVEELLKEAH